MDERFVLSRRAVLGSLGALGLSAFLPRRFARAQSTTAPTRFVFVHVPEGMWSGAQRPSGTSLGPIWEALAPHQGKINVLNNLNMQSRDHGPGGDGHHRGVPHMLTGTEMVDESNAGGASVDQKIANAIGKSSPVASLQLAVRIVYGDTNSKPLWSGPSRAVPAIQSPWEAYDRVFAGSVPTMPATGSTKPPPDLRRSALDYSLEEVTSLRTRLAPSDQALLDSYQESLRDIERRLATMPAPATGGACVKPELGSKVDVKAESNYVKVGQLQMDLMVAALQCGVTRVASLQWGNSNDQCSYSWLGVNNIGHDLAHNNNNCDPSGSKKLQVFRWYAEQAKYLLDKMDAIPEGNGTMLDNTVVLWASEFSESNGHNSDKLSWLLFGSAGGYFKTGQILDCGGKSTNDLHTSLCNAFGIADKTFGNSAYCKGPLPNLI